MRAVLALAVALSANAALADDSPGDIPRSTFLGIGRAQPQTDPRLTEQQGQWGFAGGRTWRHSRHVAFEVEVVVTGQEAEMPAVERSTAGAPGGRARYYIDVIGIGGRLKLVYPVGKLEPFAALGIGFYGSEISAVGTPWNLYLPSDVAKRRDQGVGMQYAVGLDYAVSPTWALGLEYHRLSLEAKFGPEFGGATHIGGGMLLGTLRAYSAPRGGLI